MTLCDDCDHVEAGSRKRNPNSWLCLMFPRVIGPGYVSPRTWTEYDPFMRCANINGGKCPMFKRRRDGQMESGL